MRRLAVLLILCSSASLFAQKIDLPTGTKGILPANKLVVGGAPVGGKYLQTNPAGTGVIETTNSCAQPGVFCVGEGVTQFPGSDIGAQINAAYAALPAKGGTIVIVPKADGSCYDFSTPISFQTEGKYPLLIGPGGAGTITEGSLIGNCLNFTPTVSGHAITLDYALAPGSSRSVLHGIQNLVLVNNQCQTPGGCGASTIGIEIELTNSGANTATFDNVSVVGFNTGYRNRNALSIDSQWNNPQFWDNSVALQMGLIVSEKYYGGFFDSNNVAVQAFDTDSRSELKFFGTTFVTNINNTFHYTAVVGLPANLLCVGCHVENSPTAAAHFIDGNVDPVLIGGIMEDDRPSGSSDFWIDAAGRRLVIDGTIFNTNSLNPSVGIVQSAGTARVQICGYNANPSTLTNIVGGSNAAKATVCMLNGNTSNAASTWTFESPFALTNGLSVGGGATLTKVLSATASLDFAAFAGTGACSSLTMTVTGAVSGDEVVLGIPNALASLTDVFFTGWVSANDTVTVRGCKGSAGASSDPAAATVRAEVRHF